MARPLLIPYPENASIEELKQLSRIGSSETATRCTAIQMLLAGADRKLVCKSLIVTNRALRKWIKQFNESGVDGFIAKKRPGRTKIITDRQADELAELIEAINPDSDELTKAGEVGKLIPALQLCNPLEQEVYLAKLEKKAQAAPKKKRKVVRVAAQ